jgi:hypothetical protein
MRAACSADCVGCANTIDWSDPFQGEFGNFDLCQTSQNLAISKDSVEAQRLGADALSTVQIQFRGKEMNRTVRSKVLLLCAATCFTAFTVKAATLVEGFGSGSSPAQAAQLAIEDAALTCEAIGSSLRFAQVVESGYQFSSFWARALGRCND